MKQRRINRLFTGRVVVIVLAGLIQLAWIAMTIVLVYRYSIHINTIVLYLSAVLVIAIMNSRMNPAYKLTWTITIMLVPVFGLLMYLVFGQSAFSRRMMKRQSGALPRVSECLPEKEEVREMLGKLDGGTFLPQSDLIRRTIGYPVFTDCGTAYYARAKDAMPDIMEAVRSAKEYIFLEYFIIDSGALWKSLHGLLLEKVREGVDVRVLYDDLGSAGKLSRHYDHTLAGEGIRCCRFNPVHLVNSMRINNRDHRKILVTDGRCAFVGGFNMADEYIGIRRPFGDWKDAGVRITGEAALGFAVMFLEMWAAVSGEKEDLARYTVKIGQGGGKAGRTLAGRENPGTGFVQPYSDSPLDDTFTSQSVILNLIGHAKRSIRIFTPYLVLDNEIMTALCVAASGGVSVRIFTPGVPDKKTVFLMTQSYYRQLLEAGAEILEYTPGFLHSKVILVDDIAASVGSVNLDFRSLYLHYECGVLLFGTPCVEEIRKDFERTAAVSRQITLSFCLNRSFVIRFIQAFFRIAAPLL